MQHKSYFHVTAIIYRNYYFPPLCPVLNNPFVFFRGGNSITQPAALDFKLLQQIGTVWVFPSTSALRVRKQHMRWRMCRHNDRFMKAMVLSSGYLHHLKSHPHTYFARCNLQKASVRRDLRLLWYQRSVHQFDSTLFKYHPLKSAVFLPAVMKFMINGDKSIYLTSNRTSKVFRGLINVSLKI